MISPLLHNPRHFKQIAPPMQSGKVRREIA
jgi:hypothetical protein